MNLVVINDGREFKCEADGRVTEYVQSWAHVLEIAAEVGARSIELRNTKGEVLSIEKL